MIRVALVFLAFCFVKCQKSDRSENANANELVRERTIAIKNYSDSMSVILDESLRVISANISDSTKIREVYEENASKYFCKVRQLNEDVMEVYINQRITQRDLDDYQKEIQSLLGSLELKTTKLKELGFEFKYSRVPCVILPGEIRSK